MGTSFRNTGLAREAKASVEMPEKDKDVPRLIKREVTLSFTYLFPFLRGVYSQMKEFAPLGAKSFI